LWYNNSMSFFGLFTTRKPPLQMVVDVGSHAIKALLFEKPVGRLLDKSDKTTFPRIAKKMFFKLPVSAGQDKIVARLREFIFTTVKEFERVPEKIVIALGSNLAEETLRLWTVHPSAAVKKISTRDLSVYFQNLFETNRDPKLASLAYPFGFLVNGYTVTPKVIEQINVTEIGFRTLVLSFPENVGVKLAEMKQSLGGMPIEFVPLIAAVKEAIVFSLDLRDMLLVDVGGEETNLAFVKNSEVRQVCSLAVGAHHFLRGIAKISEMTLEEAESKKRQYIQGVISEKVRSKLQEFLSQESLVWKQDFIAKLDCFYHLGPLPSKVLLFGGGAYLPEIVSILRGADWLGGFSDNNVPEVRIIEASSLFQGDSLGGFLQGPEETGLASLMIYSLRHESFW